MTVPEIKNKKKNKIYHNAQHPSTSFTPFHRLRKPNLQHGKSINIKNTYDNAVTWQQRSSPCNVVIQIDFGVRTNVDGKRSITCTNKFQKNLSWQYK